MKYYGIMPYRPGAADRVIEVNPPAKDKQPGSDQQSDEGSGEQETKGRDRPRDPERERERDFSPDGGFGPYFIQPRQEFDHWDEMARHVAEHHSQLMAQRNPVLHVARGFPGEVELRKLAVSWPHNLKFLIAVDDEHA